MARKSGVVFFLMVMRSIVVGVAYFLVREIPGLTSSFVSIFVGFLAFDMIVAMPKFSVRFRHLRDLILLLLPRISGTALSLAGGLFLGVLFGSLTKVGVPILVAAVFTIGLSYSLSASIKGNISSYVGMISAVDMFDRIVRLEYFSTEYWIQDLAGPAGTLIYSTFLALLIGWLVGIVIGSFTRLFLPRGYRSVKSSAYAQPLWMRSFRDVMHLDDDKVLLQIELSEESALAYHSLAEVGLSRDLGVQVLSIIRSPEEITSPKGADVLLPLDQLVVVVPSHQVQNLISLMKGRVLDGQV
ncbi:MAG TPA: TrkA C-terminal domain-containing protein [Limnochordia bacterium]|jgi:hypothetical protein|nr:hypothetical protein [Bacillota bacterium]HKM43020.1 TrkA C-terminal domain-containing protein [Limnochordia bacterium]